MLKLTGQRNIKYLDDVDSKGNIPNFSAFYEFRKQEWKVKKGNITIEYMEYAKHYMACIDAIDFVPIDRTVDYNSSLNPAMRFSEDFDVKSDRFNKGSFQLLMKHNDKIKNELRLLYEFSFSLVKSVCNRSDVDSTIVTQCERIIDLYKLTDQYDPFSGADIYNNEVLQDVLGNVPYLMILILNNMDSNNRLYVSQKQLAEVLQKDKSNISRNIKKLKDIGFLINDKSKGCFYINPSIATRKKNGKIELGIL